MRTIAKEFPYPTPKEAFEEQMASPMLAMALGERSKELSYHRTGLPELSEMDQALIKECLQEFESRVKKDPAEAQKFLKFLLGSGPL